MPEPHRPAPVVTVTGGPATATVDPPSATPGPGLLAVVAAVALVVAALVVSRPAPPDPPPAVDVELRVGDDAAAAPGSGGGVLVLPVDVVVRGAAVRLAGSVLWAEPVRQETVLSGRSRFEAGSTGRVRVLVQPDCSLLAPSQGHRLVLTADLELLGPDGERVREVLDLGGDPSVRARVAALCDSPG